MWSCPNISWPLFYKALILQGEIWCWLISFVLAFITNRLIKWVKLLQQFSSSVGSCTRKRMLTPKKPTTMRGCNAWQLYPIWCLIVVMLHKWLLMCLSVGFILWLLIIIIVFVVHILTLILRDCQKRCTVTNKSILTHTAALTFYAIMTVNTNTCNDCSSFPVMVLKQYMTMSSPTQ